MINATTNIDFPRICAKVDLTVMWFGPCNWAHRQVFFKLFESCLTRKDQWWSANAVLLDNANAWLFKRWSGLESVLGVALHFSLKIVEQTE